jgi:hypothetical protein
MRNQRVFPRRAASAGSAYLVTLVVLVVLTMLALALSFATQTEMMVGSNERVLQRAFYAAESAVHLAAARTLGSHDKCPARVRIQDVPRGEPGWLTQAELEIDAVVPVADPPCDYCQVNEENEYGASAFYRVGHAISVRGALVGRGGELVALKSVTAQLDVQPWSDNAIPVCPEGKP